MARRPPSLNTVPSVWHLHDTHPTTTHLTTAPKQPLLVFLLLDFFAWSVLDQTKLPIISMQNPIVTSGVDQESHLTPDPAAPFVTDGWVDMNSFHQPTTMPEYAGFSFLHISHGLPSESLARLAVAPAAPPPAQPLHAPQPHPQLQMLMMNPAPTAWPSMLTNPAPPTYAPPPPPQAAPPVPIPPIPAPIKKSGTGSQPRKTLTDEDRRRMCQYAEENPGAKQTDIGARFGVERR